ncbi:MAG: hypothetical protein QXP36_11295 [Conexivisphaerales archaeon]
MVAVLPLAIVSSVAMWLFFFIGLIFYEEGDDKRTLLFSACVVLDLLAVFSLLIPTRTILSIPAHNVTIANVPECTSTTCNSITETQIYPALNETTINPPFSNSVITLYTIFAIFQGFIFLTFAIWSLRYRLQYRTMKQYEQEMRRNRFKHL